MNKYSNADSARDCDTAHDRRDADSELKRRVRALPLFILSAPDTRLEVLDCWTTPSRYRVFKVRLVRNGRSIETQYRAPPDTLNPPTFAQVMLGLLEKCAGIEYHTFKSWCADNGFNTDSRSAESSFHHCRDVLAEVLVFLGEEAQEIRAMDEFEAAWEKFANIPTFQLLRTDRTPGRVEGEV